MSTSIDLTGAAVGDVVATRTLTFTRDSLVRYAGASGDFNPIHYRDDIAAEVGLPGVLAHGMLTMGAAVQPLVEALGDPGRVVGYQTRFTKPVVVDAAAGAEVTIETRVAALAGDDGIGRVDLTVSFEGRTVLGKAQVRVRFAPDAGGAVVGAGAVAASEGAAAAGAGNAATADAAAVSAAGMAAAAIIETPAAGDVVADATTTATADTTDTAAAPGAAS